MTGLDASERGQRKPYRLRKLSKPTRSRRWRAGTRTNKKNPTTGTFSTDRSKA